MRESEMNLLFRDIQSSESGSSELGRRAWEQLTHNSHSIIDDRICVDTVDPDSSCKEVVRPDISSNIDELVQECNRRGYEVSIGIKRSKVTMGEFYGNDVHSTSLCLLLLMALLREEEL